MDKDDQKEKPNPFKNDQWKRAAIYTRAVNAFRDTISINSDVGSEFDTRKQIKYGTKYQAAWGIFTEYCDNSTIHGIRYMGEMKRPILERLFWTIVFCSSIFICATLTMNVWDKWNNNPVIVSFAEKSTPVWQIPFPSVTVCPETKTRREIFNFTDMFWKLAEGQAGNMTEKEDYYLEAISQVCLYHLLGGFDYGSKYANGSELIAALEETNLVFNETYFFCKWRNFDSYCDKFKKMITEEGLCYSFNAFDPKDIYREEALVDDIIFGGDYNETVEWNLEDGYSDEAGPETFPHRVLGAGARAGLFLVLKGMESDLDQLCRGPVQGFKILLHTPGEVPQVSQQYFRIPFDQEVLISIKPKIITTSDGLKHYEPMRRQCYFQKERYLRFFKVYTQSNCELECLSNFTLKECGCVKFSMPRTADMPVCGAASLFCVNKAEDSLLLKEFKQGLKTSAENFRGATECNCLPACTSIAYEAEISQADYDYASQFRAYKEESYLKENAGTQMSRLSIFFKEAQFLTSKRSELYGTTDFLANCGGLLGLFMGVSTLSIVELVYFCTVRLCINLRMRRKKRLEMKRLEKANEEGLNPETDLNEKDA
ncbi:pickpocket protein 28 [Eupeodes corollae]|uniref:pickpocket protein 28 n=1 Tax=Eupeodes corollae TaxID=290404 RepID=UPI002491EC24|nr:pickpocket protein 28 [Eupeodes corollae]